LSGWVESRVRLGTMRRDGGRWQCWVGAHETVSGRLADTMKLAVRLLQKRLDVESSDSLQEDGTREQRWDAEEWKREG